VLDGVFVQCPWCGERSEVFPDASSGSAEYIEDCQVCCRPIVFHLEVDDDGASQLRIAREE